MKRNQLASSNSIKRLRNHLGIYAVAVITLAQLFGTSLWFSANSAVLDLMREWQASPADIGWLTSAVQLGFIIGTLVISVSGLADRFRASMVFTVSALVGAGFNAGFAWLAADLTEGIIYRFLVGITLAGVYPIGMKLMVQWAPERAGWALSLLVAMLTLGTALPYGLRELVAELPWREIITISSLLAVISALLIALLGDKPRVAQQPHLPTDATDHSRFSTYRLFNIHNFRAAATGYFGHMWELYAFWTIVPLYVSSLKLHESLGHVGVAGLTFFIMAMGAVGCVVGGKLSQRFGSAKVAASALTLSGLCGVVFLFGWRFLPAWVLLVVLLLWGATVIADSPHFSALSAKACPPRFVGSALALQNSIGFVITIISITITTYLFEEIGLDSAIVLLLGPVLGITGFRKFNRHIIKRQSY